MADGGIMLVMKINSGTVHDYYGCLLVSHLARQNIPLTT